MAKPRKNGEVRRPRKPPRDPDIDVLVGETKNWKTTELYNRSYISQSAIRNLREQRPGRKRTKYPQHMTMVGIAAAAGLEYRLVKK